MARAPTGSVVERETSRGVVYALRFRAYGRSRYVTLGAEEDGWTRRRAALELANVQADVRRGIWQEPESVPIEEQAKPEPTFHEFASGWWEGRKADGVSERTLADYRWSLTLHLLPFFARFVVSAIGIEEVDRYRRAKVTEREIQLAAYDAWSRRKIRRARHGCYPTGRSTRRSSIWRRSWMWRSNTAT